MFPRIFFFLNMMVLLSIKLYSPIQDTSVGSLKCLGVVLGNLHRRHLSRRVAKFQSWLKQLSLGNAISVKIKSNGINYIDLLFALLTISK